MFVRVKQKSENKYAVQIVESVRDGNGGVKQKIIRHVGMAFNNSEVVALKELAESIKIQIEESHQPSLFGAEESLKMLKSNKKDTRKDKKDNSKNSANNKSVELGLPCISGTNHSPNFIEPFFNQQAIPLHQTS